jgi:hypothetical protein
MKRIAGCQSFQPKDLLVKFLIFLERAGIAMVAVTITILGYHRLP